MATEKRFAYDNKQGAILKNNKFWLEGAIATACNHSEICNELNNLVDENEQLKSTINTLTHDNTKMKKVLNTTKKENEHIKNTIQEAYNNERTHLGKSVLKQLLNNIGEI